MSGLFASVPLVVIGVMVSLGGIDRRSASGNGMTGSYRAVTCGDTIIGTLAGARQ